MFQKLQHRLLASYLVVLAAMLGTFAIAVRVIFARSLAHQMTNQLETLAQGVAANTEFDKSHHKLGEDFSLQDLSVRHRAIQWFDPQGHLVQQKGTVVVSLPLSLEDSTQIQLGKPRLESVTLPILDGEEKRFLGYVRVSQSLEENDETLQKLDVGLTGGIVIALLLSSVGGIWLTQMAMQPIEQSVQRLKQFTADASHELRSPLMAIKSNAAVALKYAEGMRLTDWEKFQAIASATKQMTRLTEELLLLARMEQSTKQHWQPVPLVALLKQLIQQYESPAATKQIHLKSSLTGSLTVWGDAAQLTQLFDNLINNALSYTPVGGTIEVQANQIEQTLVVDVRDTGIGIAPENLERVFDRFWRADQSRTHWAGGSGLGLAIAQAIAQAHRGSITVSSQFGAGSCFTVRLPA
ncbi:MAG: ATP-binding protein [Leptolyngbya sp. BL-A-14]